LKRLTEKLHPPKNVSKIVPLVPSVSPSPQNALVTTTPTVPATKPAGEISAPAVSEKKEED
ncbi:MAG TPA: hypothetical protein VE955_01965, partial [Candidatus Dormibacteraeota bacterium]|nr:hypothetical protein [Candidatus Dormibacteraeota bacterium]